MIRISFSRFKRNHLVGEAAEAEMVVIAETESNVVEVQVQK